MIDTNFFGKLSKMNRGFIHMCTLIVLQILRQIEDI